VEDGFWFDQAPIRLRKNIAYARVSLTGAGEVAVVLPPIPVIETSCFPRLKHAPGDNPDTPSGQLHLTVRDTGMVDVPHVIAEGKPVDSILVAEDKNSIIPLRQALHAFLFGNPLPDIGQDAGVLWNILERKESVASDP
jgi:hypothetical protein